MSWETTQSNILRAIRIANQPSKKSTHIQVCKDVVHFYVESCSPEEAVVLADQIQVYAGIRTEHIRKVMEVFQAASSVRAILGIGRHNLVVVQRTVQCRMVRNDERKNRILTLVITEVRKNIQTGVRFPRERLAAFKFVFAIHGAHVRRHREW